MLPTTTRASAAQNPRARHASRRPIRRCSLIRDIPYGTTTTAVMESIVKAAEANKIKIKKVVDNTAADVEIEVQLPIGRVA